MADLITKGEFAKRLKTSAAYVSKLAKQGRLVMQDGKVDYEATVEGLSLHADPARAPFRKDTSNVPRGTSLGDRPTASYEQIRTAKEAARTRLTQLQVKEKEGDLVSASEVKHLLTAHITSVKTQLRAIPAKCAQEIAHMRSADMSSRDRMAEVQRILLSEIDSVLKDLSVWTLKV